MLLIKKHAFDLSIRLFSRTDVIRARKTKEKERENRFRAKNFVCVCSCWAQHRKPFTIHNARHWKQFSVTLLPTHTTHIQIFWSYPPFSIRQAPFDGSIKAFIATYGFDGARNNQKYTFQGMVRRPLASRRPSNWNAIIKASFNVNMQHILVFFLTLLWS